MFKNKSLIFLLLITAIPSFLIAQVNPAFKAIKPRFRVIMDNDFGGDPDGLFALTHLVLSPSVEVRGVIGSHLNANDGFDKSKTQADNAVKKAAELLDVLKVKNRFPLVAGSNTAMINDTTPVKSAAVDLIIKEASRTDTSLPLYILCGAGLTEIASAVLTEPKIADKVILVWIGGPEYADIAMPPPNFSSPEYNLNIDIAAARAVFNHSQLKLWQIPRDAYRQAILPWSELQTRIKPHGETGKYLAGVLENLMVNIQQYKLNLGEVYILGDSPLVLLTALQSSFEADPSSSEYVLKPCPLIDAQGGYAYNSYGRNIRVYRRLDINLMFNDFFAKLELNK
ncbi:inosine-uridine nucleoside N-ribohydrolase [Mucilaginibacter oryzae]|uniref:Inosine-uridine nucleoside N-ribohydrolase n=1 Tax=Mucilaginibacter oryzae TaxID=468058 RepID=A0A316H6I2_9SPHI|nr:nucleoside hydrolase [Mucilaginibacter oryzae]PWK75983.1 inosine-uridine nucleoside N-ribohydrolase [Mucilaginibacter oryzae]